jgi:Polyprenyl synthetase
VAINDGIVLESCIYRILQKHFRRTPQYMHLLELFHEVGHQHRCKICLFSLALVFYKVINGHFTASCMLPAGVDNHAPPVCVP